MSPIPLSYNDKFEEVNECSELQKSAIDEIKKAFELNTKELSEVVNHFCNEFNKGLEKHGQTVAMIPSYGNLLIVLPISLNSFIIIPLTYVHI